MRAFLFLLISTFCLTSFCQNTNLNSFFNKLDSLKSDSKKIDFILNIPFDISTKNIQEYDSLVNISISLSKKINDSLLLANSFDKKALSLHFTSKDKEALEFTLKAIEIYKNLNKIDDLANSYLNLGWKIKYRDLKNAIIYMRKGIKILENNNPSSSKLTFGYNNYGVLLSYKSKIDSAIIYHKKSLTLAKKNKDSIGIPFAYTHIGSSLLKKKNFILSKKYIDSSLVIRTLRKDYYGITDSELYLGDLFFEKKEFTKAINHFKKAYNLATEKKIYPLKKYASELLAKSYDSINNYKETLKYLKIYTEMKDSILNVNTNNKISELNLKFQTTEKEKEIAQQKEQLLEQELAIKNRNLYAIILASSLLILGILSLGYYHRSKFKRKQLQKEIDLKDALATIKTQNRLQEQRLRISRDLHDNIGSQLTFIISSLDNLKFVTKDANSKLKNKLSGISSFTSDTIHQLRDTIWAMNKSEITIEDLHTRILSFVEKAKLATENIEFEINQNLNIEFQLTSIEGMNLFRVIQEAINNAIKYAEASKVSISLKNKEKTLYVSIIDNGIGFDINNVDLGNGLSNIEKRISEINGKVKIVSKKNMGTEINISILLKNTTNDV